MLSSRLRAVLKRLAAYALYYSGALWLYAAVRLRDRAVVLMYHRVLPPDADSFSAPGITVTPSNFALQMRFLSKHFEPLSVARFMECMERGRFPRRACLITFDDGWADNAETALPILTRFEVPAVFFVTTAYVGTERTFWQERLTRWLFEAARRPTAAGLLLKELGLDELMHASDQDARRLVRDYVTGLKVEDESTVEELSRRIRSTLFEDADRVPRYGDDRFMSWDAVRTLAASRGCSIASHSHDHVPLTRLQPAEVAEDLTQSRRVLQQQGFATSGCFAYPNGDHDDAVVASVSEAGVRLAFTTLYGHVHPSDDPLRLRRINVHEAAGRSRAEFFCRLLGLF
jgi:peptidoglycan/xylan/chitin deacetylase (PgdA/CDA1 family)